MNLIFASWREYPPVNVLLKSLLEGLGAKPEDPTVTPSELAELHKQVGSALPIIKGRDVGLPKSTPVFDLDEMRRKNQTLIKNRLKK